MKERTNILEEFIKLGKNFLAWIVVFISLAIFFFTFGLKEITVSGAKLFLPFPTVFHSFSLRFFEFVKENLLPDGVELIVTDPLNAFLSQIIIALSLGFIFSLPFFLYKFIKFVSPALYLKERKVMRKVLFPSTALFFGGVLFAYWVLIPPTFRILYSFAEAIEAATYFTAKDFVVLLLGFSIGVGIMFLTPIFMALLSHIGLVKAEFWKDHWRYSTLFFLIFSAIITPGGSGITMLILFFPLLALYFLGYFLSLKKIIF